MPAVSALTDTNQSNPLQNILTCSTVYMYLLIPQFS